MFLFNDILCFLMKNYVCSMLSKGKDNAAESHLVVERNPALFLGVKVI